MLEIGAGTVVPSIRYQAENEESKARGGLIRINPSAVECADTGVDAVKYIPIVAKSQEALDALVQALDE